MAKATKVVAPKLVNKKGKEKPEYPKLVKISDHETIAGKGVAQKILVNSEEEEAEVIKKYKLDAPETTAKTW